MSIIESLSKKNDLPVIKYFDINLSGSTFTPEQASFLAESCVSVETDIKNKIVKISFIEYDYNDFYRMLINITNETNMSLLLISKTPIYNGNQKFYQSKLPHLLFTKGRVLDHKLHQDIREDSVCKHSLTIKFERFESRTEDLTI